MNQTNPNAVQTGTVLRNAVTADLIDSINSLDIDKSLDDDDIDDNIIMRLGNPTVIHDLKAALLKVIENTSYNFGMDRAQAASLLGISPNASCSQAKKGFRKQSLECHPDRPNGDRDLFHQLTEALESFVTPPRVVITPATVSPFQFDTRHEYGNYGASS